jgi:hypothetical protein
MVIHGEDSLNEETEDEGLEDDEPTPEQLVATGEQDEDEEDEIGGAEKSTEGLTLLIPKELPSPGAIQKTESTGALIERRLLEGTTREELVAEGYNANSVRTIYSTLKSKGELKPSAPASGKKKKGEHAISANIPIPVFAKGSPPEAIISAMRMPDVSNGQGFSFEQGMKFGLSVAVLGIRMAQELSAVGVQQAKPLIDMAKEMRTGEEAAAKNAAGEAANEAAGMVYEKMMPMIASLQKGGGGASSDPMRDMMVRQIEPLFGNIMQSVMGGMLTGGSKPPQITAGSMPSPPAAPSTGWIHTEE